MSEKILTDYINRITPPDAKAMELAAARQASLAKPPGSLGFLEDISVKFAGITGKVTNTLDKTRVVVLCADNGVTEEGVSSTPVPVTAAQAVNMTKRCTGMSSIAGYFGDDVQVVDMGIVTPYDCPEILDRRVRCGTGNISKGPAMTRDEAVRAILTGIELAANASADGIKIIGSGEMGIGNTTTSAAVLSVLTGASVSEVTGKGAGLTPEAYENKKAVITKAIEINKPDPEDVIDVISKVGGLDMAAMCGLFLGGAVYHIPVVIDGLISAVSALSAYRLCPYVREYMFASHVSFEPGYNRVIDELGLKPVLDLDMRLGEGSGCPLAFRIIEGATAAMNGTALFGEESDIDDGYLEEIRKGDSFSV